LISVILVMAMATALHHGEGICKTAESCRDVARERE
jgi:hypothetical protein